MPYVCVNEDCTMHGNLGGLFRRTEYGRCDYSCNETIDADGENVDSDNYEYDDHNTSDYGDVVCDECGQEAEFFDSNEEAEDFLNGIKRKRETKEDKKKLLNKLKKVI